MSDTAQVPIPAPFEARMHSRYPMCGSRPLSTDTVRLFRLMSGVKESISPTVVARGLHGPGGRR